MGTAAKFHEIGECSQPTSTTFEECNNVVEVDVDAPPNEFMSEGEVSDSGSSSEEEIEQPSQSSAGTEVSCNRS